MRNVAQLRALLAGPELGYSPATTCVASSKRLDIPDPILKILSGKLVANERTLAFYRIFLNTLETTIHNARRGVVKVRQNRCPCLGKASVAG